MSNIAIVGMGWLGKPLAVALQQKGHNIKGSSTNKEKLKMLNEAGLPSFYFLLTEDGLSGEITGFLSAIDILIVLIPPGLRHNSGHNHTLKMLHFVNEIERAGIKRVILVSSTGVYDDSQGNVTEDDSPEPTLNNGKQLLETELMFSNSEAFKATIVRFGGLFGGSRNPVKYLAGRTGLSNGEAPVNLIHRIDCIAIINEIIKQDAFGHIFNAVAPEHPKKSDYYHQKAVEMGIKPPEYSTDNEEEIYKRVDSVNLKKKLRYSFKVKI